ESHGGLVMPRGASYLLQAADPRPRAIGTPRQNSSIHGGRNAKPVRAPSRRITGMAPPQGRNTMVFTLPTDLFRLAMETGVMAMQAQQVVAMRTLGLMGAWRTRDGELGRMLT